MSNQKHEETSKVSIGDDPKFMQLLMDFRGDYFDERDFPTLISRIDEFYAKKEVAVLRWQWKAKWSDAWSDLTPADEAKINGMDVHLRVADPQQESV